MNRFTLLTALALACAAPTPAHAAAPDEVALDDSGDPPAVAPAEMDLSLAERIARDPVKLAQFEREIAAMTQAEADELLYSWDFNARPKQRLPKGDWRTWLISAGRGFGKTRTGAETVREWARNYPRIALIGATAADTRDTMVEGESGILAVHPPGQRPKYEPSKRRVTWPNGAMATLFSADEPDRLRGPQHQKAWADELAAWRYIDAWDQLQFGLRLGDNPQTVVTTTPRPIPLVKELIAESRRERPTVVVTRGSTNENRANLAKAFLAQIVAKYEGTRLGRQELDAEVLDDVPGALWRRDPIDALRVRTAPDLERIVVGVDPSVAAEGEGDECGVVAAGKGLCSCRGTPEVHAFVLEDGTDHLSPNEWAQRAVAIYKRRDADRIVAEVNNGGALVEMAIRTVNRNASYKAVHAAKGKRTRAEPVAALYEQGKVHHVGALPKLEDELTTWDPSVDDRSPNRLDATVWALTELMLGDHVPTSRSDAPRIKTALRM